MASVYLRIRQIKPEITRNSVLARLGPEVTLFFIGLWMVADDVGVVTWKPDQIAALLYQYKGVATREKLVTKALQQLIDADPEDPMVTRLDCGRHVLIPGFVKHQVVASTRRTTQHLRDHNERCVENGHGALSIAVPVKAVGATMQGHSGNGTGTGTGTGARNAGALSAQQSSDGMWHTGQHPDCATCATYRSNVTGAKR